MHSFSRVLLYLLNRQQHQLEYPKHQLHFVCSVIVSANEGVAERQASQNLIQIHVPRCEGDGFDMRLNGKVSLALHIIEYCSCHAWSTYRRFGCDTSVLVRWSLWVLSNHTPRALIHVPKYAELRALGPDKLTSTFNSACVQDNWELDKLRPRTTLSFVHEDPFYLSLMYVYAEACWLVQ